MYTRHLQHMYSSVHSVYTCHVQRMYSSVHSVYTRHLQDIYSNVTYKTCTTVYNHDVYIKHMSPTTHLCTAVYTMCTRVQQCIRCVVCTHSKYNTCTKVYTMCTQQCVCSNVHDVYTCHEEHIYSSVHNVFATKQ